jgi:hypothetical protein
MAFSCGYPTAADAKNWRRVANESGCKVTAANQHLEISGTDSMVPDGSSVPHHLWVKEDPPNLRPGHYNEDVSFAHYPDWKMEDYTPGQQ